jgi:hypothetical protein
MWRSTDERLALLELLTRGALKRRTAQASAFDTLAELPWTRATGRRDEIRLVEERRPDLVRLLERVWPTWGESLTELTARGFPATPDGWAQLEDARRAGSITRLPDRLNRRTAAAHAAPHSKAALTERRRAALGATAATHDGTVRLRPPAGLIVRTHAGKVDLSAVAKVLGEVAIAERAFLQGLALEGDIRAVLFIENLGAWRDLPAPPGWLLAHVPGWDTVAAGHLLDRLSQVPVVHFGDLDPNGVRIFRHLRERRPDLRWFVPAFWAELAESHGQPGEWPSELALDDAPPLVRELAARGLWLEQERLVLDERVPAALAAMVEGTR